MFTAKVTGKSKSATLKTAVTLLLVLFLAVPGTGLLSIDLSQASGGSWDDDRDDDDDNHWRRPRFCSQTAKVVFDACGNELKDDYSIAIANCTNVSDNNERKECVIDAHAEKKEGKELCKEQFEARLEVCDLVGEKRYDPDFDPENFVDPREIGGSVSPNPFFPLVAGTQWVYVGTFEDDEGAEVTERITVTVTDKIKLIEGVTCVVVNDLVTEDDVPIEDTDDWYAQDEDGNVWYCGEIAKNFETFEGDDPDDPELVDIEGSWKAGRDGAKPGILVLAAPEVRDVYRQEVSWGDAEDVAEVISITGTTESVPFVNCSGDCLVTRESTPIEPGVNENKYYKPDVGLILEVDMEGNRVKLISKGVVTP